MSGMDERAATVAGLRALADFIETHPDLPLTTARVAHYPRGTDEEKWAEIDRIATILGTTTRSVADGEHYMATLRFGPVSYEATAITRAEMARHNALTSYSNAVEPVSEEDGR